MRFAVWTIAALFASLCAIAGTAIHAGDATTAAAPGAANAIVFERDIRPILRAHCLDCHGATDELKGGLDLRLRRFILKGGESGASIDPGHADKSLLIQRVRAKEMPPETAPLSEKEIAVLEQWVNEGAVTARDEPEVLDKGLSISPEDREFWSFQPLTRPAVPQFSEADRVRTPIDAFLLEKLRGQNLSFSPDAEKIVLLRRVTFDLIGLPPTPEETAQFLADESPEAYERLIDRLLASPHYGERWGRHWLDAAGYADSEGDTERDQQRPYIYKYRDYVIRSMNADKPFDRFIQEQLAGDEMVTPPYTNLSPEAIELLTATGYLRMGIDGTASGSGDQESMRNQVMADTIKIVSTSLLGLTVGCAQCHDHRYDPILQSDYYRMRAVFEPAYNWKNWTPPSSRIISLYTDAERAKANEINAEAAVLSDVRNKKQQEYINTEFEKELLKFAEPLREPIRTAFHTPADKRTPEQQDLLKKNPSANIDGGNLYQYNMQSSDDIKKRDAEIAGVYAKRPVEDYISVLTEVPGNVPETFVFHRGDHRQPKEKVEPAGLTIAAPPGQRFDIPEKNPALQTSGRRTAYAAWLTSGSHPLVTRVLVNRVWMHHFGKGLVETPGDFGALGSRPTHPQLLDWLATEFVAQEWSLKRLHKLIMLSTAYQQSSYRDREKEAVDPDNLLYWRKPVVRLDAEAIRDSMLAVSGTFNARMYGSPIPVKEDAVGQIVVGVDSKTPENRPGDIIPLNGEEFRRSVFIEVRRSRPLAMLRAFDAPVMETNCDKRPSSTVSPQALMLMNSDFVVSQSELFAARLEQEFAGDVKSQIGRAWQLSFARPATEVEMEQATKFLSQQSEFLQSQPAAEGATKLPPQESRRQALRDFCQALISANEFLYVD